MQQVSNYLQEISRFLPAESRDDILEELRTSIEDQVTDLATSEGRSPAIEDENAVLALLGHPLKVAAGYLPQRHLIGPALFPIYLRALSMILLLVLSVQAVIILIVSATSGSTTSPLAMFFGLFDTAFLVAAIVTGVFAILEYSGERLHWYDNWRPQSLGSGRTHVINRSDVTTNLVSEGVFLLWWNDALVFFNWLPVLGEDSVLSLSAVWTPFFWPLNILFGAAFVLHVFVLSRGVWKPFTLAAELLLNVAVLIIAGMLIGSGDLVVAHGVLEEMAFGSLQHTARAVLIVIAGFVLWDIWLAARRLAAPLAQTEAAGA